MRSRGGEQISSVIKECDHRKTIKPKNRSGLTRITVPPGGIAHKDFVTSFSYAMYSSTTYCTLIIAFCMVKPFCIKGIDILIKDSVFSTGFLSLKE
jgi:hypothetical protein